MNMPRMFLVALASSLAIITRCGPDPNLGQVAGIVTYNGEPVEGATVSFFPASPDGVLAVGVTDADGRYVLQAPLERRGATQGAFAGTYNVTIRKLEVTPNPVDILYQQGLITYDEFMDRGGGGGGTSRDILPDRFRDVQQSGLQVEVQARTQHEFNFDLVD